jgi:hypothetical protein
MVSPSRLHSKVLSFIPEALFLLPKKSKKPMRAHSNGNIQNRFPVKQ